MVKFYLPICLFEFTAPHQAADLCNELTQVFAKNTHVYFTNERVQLLGRHPFGWWFLYFAVLANRPADMMQLMHRMPDLSLYAEENLSIHVKSESCILKKLPVDVEVFV